MSLMLRGFAQMKYLIPIPWTDPRGRIAGTIQRQRPPSHLTISSFFFCSSPRIHTASLASLSPLSLSLSLSLSPSFNSFKLLTSVLMCLVIRVIYGDGVLSWVPWWPHGLDMLLCSSPCRAGLRSRTNVEIWTSWRPGKTI